MRGHVGQLHSKDALGHLICRKFHLCEHRQDSGYCMLPSMCGWSCSYRDSVFLMALCLLQKQRTSVCLFGMAEPCRNPQFEHSVKFSPWFLWNSLPPFPFTTSTNGSLTQGVLHYRNYLGERWEFLKSV